MQIRRVQFTGGSSCAMTRPKEWIDARKIKMNDPDFFYRRGCSRTMALHITGPAPNPRYENQQVIALIRYIFNNYHFTVPMNRHKKMHFLLYNDYFLMHGIDQAGSGYRGRCGAR